MAVNTTDADLEKLWDELADVPFNEEPDGTLVLAEDWLDFPAGTEREEIWDWFDQMHSVGVVWLMYERSK